MLTTFASIVSPRPELSSDEDRIRSHTGFFLSSQLLLGRSIGFLIGCWGGEAFQGYCFDEAVEVEELKTMLRTTLPLNSVLLKSRPTIKGFQDAVGEDLRNYLTRAIRSGHFHTWFEPSRDDEGPSGKSDDTDPGTHSKGALDEQLEPGHSSGYFFQPYIRTFTYRLCGGGGGSRVKPPTLLEPGRIPLDKIGPPQFVSANSSAATNIVAAVQAATPFVKDLMLPVYYVPEPTAIDFRLSMSQWAAVASAMSDSDSFLYLQARLLSPSADTVSYVREVVSALRESSQSSSYTPPGLYDAILSGQPVVQLFAVSSDSSMVREALVADSGRALELFPGTLLSKTQHAAIRSLPYMFTLEEATLLMTYAFSTLPLSRLPQTDCRRFLSFPAAFTATSESNVDKLRIGRLLDEESAYYVPLSALASHTLVVGRTGSGKSHTICQLVSQLRRRQLPCLVIDAVKGDIASYVRATGGTVFEPGRRPFTLHLFSPEVGEFIEQRCHLISEVLSLCYPMNEVGAAEWNLIVIKTYKDSLRRAELPVPDERSFLNLTGELFVTAPQALPTWEDLCRSGEDYISGVLTNTKSRRAQDAAFFFLNSLEALKHSRIAELFTPDPMVVSSLLEDYSAITLESFADANYRRAVIVGIVLALRERRKFLNIHRRTTSAPSDRPLHFTVIDEAHFVAPRVSKDAAAQIIASETRLAELTSNAIRELRGYGESVILADQSPSEISATLLRNAGFIICHALQEGQDRECIRNAMGLSMEQADALSKLTHGSAVLSVYGRTPVLVEVDDPFTDKRTLRF